MLTHHLSPEPFPRSDPFTSRRFLETLEGLLSLVRQEPTPTKLCARPGATQGVLMSKLRPLIAVTLSLVLFSSTSQAWWALGHMAMAYVAYQKLTPEKRIRVAKLLK